MTSGPLALVHLGRPQGRGEVQRVASWRSIAEAAGIAVADVPLLGGGRPSPSAVRPRQLADLARGAIVPEALAWSHRAAMTRVEEARPSAVLVVSARAFSPVLTRVCPVTVLDLVDRLSVSYRARARITSSRSAAAAFEILAGAHSRFERTPPGGVTLVAAGWNEAAVLGAEFVPNVVKPLPRDASSEPQFDLLFLGTLDYPPNVAGLRKLSDLWGALQRARPRTTLLVAGARPPSEVIELVSRHGWHLEADFGSLRSLAGRARAAVAPLPYASGIQNKVLEAAALALPQVVSPAVAEGLPPNFPVRVADDRALPATVARLLHDPEAARREGEEARDHVEERFSAPTWSAWLTTLVSPGGQ